MFVATLIFGLLYVLFILPQQRRVKAHQQTVARLEEGDEVVMTAGIYGRIVRLGPEDLDLEVAPGVELKFARQAVLRRVEHAVDIEAETDNNADAVQRGDDLSSGSSGQ